MRKHCAIIFAMFMAISLYAIQPQNTEAFPGPGRVLTMSHALIPPELGALIQGVQLSNVDHTGYTMIRDGVAGVFHSDGVAGARFTAWDDFRALYVSGTLRAFKPNYTEAARRELALYGIQCEILATALGELRKTQWLAELLKYDGKPYDFGFQPGPEAVYCSELGAHAWNAICPVPLLPSQLAETSPGWNLVVDENGTTLGMIFMSIGVMPNTPVWAPAYPTWDTELFTEQEIIQEMVDGC